MWFEDPFENVEKWNLEKLALRTGEMKSGAFTAVSAHTLPAMSPCNSVFVFALRVESLYLYLYLYLLTFICIVIYRDFLQTL